MSLDQNYTWHDFKREKGKEAQDLKRTSPEGKKAFEAAREANLKDVVKARLARFEKEKQKTQKKIQTLKDSLKNFKTKERKTLVLKKIQRSQNRIQDLEASMKRDQSRSQ